MKTGLLTSLLPATLSRRSILRYLVAGLGAGGLGLMGCRRSDPARLVAPLRELARHPESLAAIGQAFLEEYPRENLETITEWLAAKLDWHEGMPADELGRRLGELVRSDFRDSKTQRVSHWILSETEVRWAAVVALAPPGSAPPGSTS
jgi:hypothetical protein